jgi:hypothetical protein
VVCGFFEVMDIFSPSKRFNKVDFPTLGAPTMVTNPDLKSDRASDVVGFFIPHTDPECRLEKVGNPGSSMKFQITILKYQTNHNDQISMYEIRKCPLKETVSGRWVIGYWNLSFICDLLLVI